MAFTDLDEFELARKRAERESKVRLQTRQDALQRRFASLGNLDSGIQLKQASLAEQEEGQALGDVREGINAAERQELRRRRELAEQRQFQTSERLGSQGFVSGESALGRRFATGERLGSQGFASGEAALGRRFATSERLGSQGFASGEAKTGREFGAAQAEIGRRFATGERREAQDFSARERGSAQAFSSQETAKAQAQQASQFARQFDLTRKQFDVSQDQFDRTFAEEVRINNKNIEFAEKVLSEKDLIETILTPVQQKVGSFVEETFKRWF